MGANELYVCVYISIYVFMRVERKLGEWTETWDGADAGKSYPSCKFLVICENTACPILGKGIPPYLLYRMVN